MAKMSSKAIVFNIAAIVVAVSAAGAAVRSYLVKPSVAPCETRHSNILAFKLERDGRIVTPVDLQGRSGGRDLGLDRNLEIGPAPGAPRPVAMKVRLSAGDGGTISGMSFPWEPANIRPHSTACLAYSVRFSDNLDENFDGVLPGLQGGAEDTEQRFSVSPAWIKAAESGIATDIVLKNVPGEPAQPKPQLIIESSEVPLPKGRWLRVNQEVTLNAPEESDGIVRIWVDGKLVIERTDVRLRNDAAVVLTGVGARVQMLADAGKGAATTESSIELTTFELMW